TLHDSKILGFPIRIDNKKYARNAFHFNLCFVCDAWTRSVPYEPVVKKLSDYLVNIKLYSGALIVPGASNPALATITMELESHFLSEAGGQIEAGKAHLPVMFKQVIQDLNIHKMCTL
ncbi:unnamed protein product, partial [Timema podura]|nr:unnamed protein product [Timema podura]